MLEVEGFRRNFSNTGFAQPPQIIYTGTNNATVHPVSHHPFLPLNQGQPWLQEQEGERPSRSPDTGSQSAEEDEDDEYRPFTPPPPRERLSYTRYQLELLNCIYNHVRYPNSTQKQLIAKRVGITREQVKIWFQNRRRKDVVGKQEEKSKPEDPESPDDKNGESDKSDVSDKVHNGDSDSGVSDTGSSNDEQEKSMVPTVVLKSIIAELNRFEKDALKPKKKTKKKSKTVKKKELKASLANALLQGGFDIVNPPNQVVPSARGQKHVNKFSHCSKSSAFESPRDSSKTVPNIFDFQSIGSAAMMRSPTRAYMSNTLGLPTGALGCDLPVLSDLLTASAEQRKEPGETRSIPCRNPNSPMDRERRGEFSPNHPHFPSPYSNPYGYIHPYHFLAEPGFMLSTLRHSEPYRHFGHYPPIFCSEPSSFHQITPAHLSNPYYSTISPASSLPWNNHNFSSSSSNDSTYEQL
ncbi:uncharacterized protein LOC134230576 [Saccostrea cucullata]|uniref:uncharacterized protein LOC134230576 n=1 Tax=Saccostrea cuccullata TaxID=36930 RepID=UPI002ED482FB